MKMPIEVECPSDLCDKKKKFPINAEPSNDEDAVNSLQVKCPFCDKSLTVEFLTGVKSSNVGITVRG